MRTITKQLGGSLCFNFILMCTLFAMGCNKKPMSKSTEYQVESLSGNQLIFENGMVVALVGVYIPYTKDVNFMPELHAEIEKLLLGKKLTVETVLKKHNTGYPRLDLVRVWLGGTYVNEYLLRNGMGFFYEDYWDKEEKERFRKISSQAKEDGVGLWQERDKLTVLLVRDRDWFQAYSPECEFTKGILPEKRIEYYVPPPASPWGGIVIDTVCAEPNESVFLKE